MQCMTVARPGGCCTWPGARRARFWGRGGRPWARRASPGACCAWPRTPARAPRGAGSREAAGPRRPWAPPGRRGSCVARMMSSDPSLDGLGDLNSAWLGGNPPRNWRRDPTDSPWCTGVSPPPPGRSWPVELVGVAEQGAAALYLEEDDAEEVPNKDMEIHWGRLTWRMLSTLLCWLQHYANTVTRTQASYNWVTIKEARGPQSWKKN